MTSEEVLTALRCCARRQCDVEYCPFEVNGACKLEG